MKKYFLILLSFLLFQSCITIKIYDKSGNLTETIKEPNRLINSAIKGDIVLDDEKAIILDDGKRKKIRIRSSKKVGDSFVFISDSLEKEESFSVKIDDVDDKKGSKAKIMIRSNGNKNPYILIDGKEQSPDFDLSSISPDQIEKIDVLKGEAALKIAGEKGKNGVIKITLKK
jgi:bla regulator protein BlaR1